jgi:multidrug resistance efflux pump
LKFSTLILVFITFALSTISLVAEPVTAAMQSSIEGQMIYEVPLGAHVKKGQLLEAIDPTEYQEQLLIDTAIYEDQKGLFDSDKKLLRKTVPYAIYSHDKYLYLEALHQYIKDKEVLKHTKIYAPFDGIVSKIYVYPGSGIGDGSDIMRITKS